MPLSVGDKLGHYEVISLLGQGGMGEVYRARDTTLKRDVALKVLPATFLRDPERMARFQREAEVLASLDHPNIGHIHGIVDSEDSRGLVLALIEGPTLADRIEAGPVPLDEAVAIAKQIIDALEYAHDRGVIHRDLKPANVKITPEGVVKVLDFGLAKMLEDEPPPSSLANSPTLTLGHTRAGVILGTAAYMSPEQAVGRPVDRRSDIFSFGAVLYEMLAGKRAFAGATTPDVLEAVVKNDPYWSALPAGTPRYLRRLLERTLAKDRKQRLQAIGEARIALENPDRSEPGAATAPSQSRFGKIAGIAAAVMTVVAVGLGTIAYRATQPAPLRPLMSLSLDVPDETSFSLATNSGGVALTGNGSRLVLTLRAADGNVRLYTRLVGQNQMKPLPGTEGARDPFFSPDGEWIGFFADSKLRKIPVEGGAAVTLCDAPNNRGASWDDDGNIIVALTGAGVLSRVPSAGGAPVRVTKVTGIERTHRWPRVLPGSQVVLYTDTAPPNYDDSIIAAVSLQTGEQKTLLRGGFSPRYIATSHGSGHLIYLRQNTLFAVAFDPARLMLTGTPVPILEEVASSATGGGISPSEACPPVLVPSSTFRATYKKREVYRSSG
jgi:serine/threonine protein kinase